ncbi:winged helix-turn-helix transcriptional regulator [Qipengyuania vesicularis]|uniref:winged helix-turn-helix transcriptional regulator n=1 Tax=Qipengyuania vesicularis TaxID=2867232 RepID=UPI001C873D01|nr:helix-turn-helix domain-containing protein [Qipengyuania vesicularis]MBX7528003.1 helix-turn-helix transcriptional regulator [Qipengyuania vesicularis]
MPELASHCPATKAADILGDKWVLQILRAMTLGASRYSDFTAAMPRISPSVLSARLKKLTEDGLIVKRGDAGQQAVYRLAPAGREAQPIVMMLAEWGKNWAERHTRADQIDVGVAMWDLHRTINTAELPDGETVFSFTLSDLNEHNRWWIVAERNVVDLCDKDPGKPVDLYVHAPLQSLIEIWMGEAVLDELLRSEVIIMTGEKLLTDTANRWFPISPVVLAKQAGELGGATAGAA